MAVWKNNTLHHACGCISQHADRRGGAINWVYCGNKDCSFDEVGAHRKDRPARPVTLIDQVTYLPANSSRNPHTIIEQGE